MARAQGPAPSFWLGRLALALIVTSVAFSAYVLWRSAVLTPYYDELDWILRWRALAADGDWGRYLFTPVNLHRVPFVFGLLALDIQVFSGTNWPLIASGALALGVLAWILAREGAKAAPPPLPLPAAAAIAMLALTPPNLLDAAMPICVNYLHGAAFAVLAMVLAEGRDGPGVGWRRLTALAAAVLAGFGDAAALAVWPAMAIAALRRRDVLWFAAILVAGTAFVSAYAWGQAASAEGATSGALHDPMSALRLALNFIALPWTQVNIELAWIPGLAIAAVSLAAVTLRGGSMAARSERLAVTFILFSLGVTAMAALGRTAGDVLNVPLRYSVLLAPLHAGLVILALPYADDLWRANRRGGDALWAAALVLLALQGGLMAVRTVRTSDVVRNTIAEFKAGVTTPRTPLFIHPNPAHAERIYADLHRDGLYQRELHLKRTTPAR